MYKNKIIFKGEIPVSVDNLDAYDKIFVIETWMRRITFVSLMIRHGSKWPDVFPKSEREKVEKNIAKSIDNPLLGSYEAGNLMWFTTLNELKDILHRQDIADIILEITGSPCDTISEKLEKLNTIRNDIAHNRIITIESLRTFNKLCKDFFAVIDEFKRRYVHKNDYDIKFTERDSDNQAIKYFLNRMEDNDWGEFQGFIEDDENSIQVVQLPGGVNFDHPYIHLELLLKKYESVVDQIMGFFINKGGCEYRLIWSKHETINVSIQKKIIDIFLDSKFNLWIDTDYKKQDGKSVFNPILWYYD